MQNYHIRFDKSKKQRFQNIKHVKKNKRANMQTNKIIIFVVLIQKPLNFNDYEKVHLQCLRLHLRPRFW